MTDNEYLDRLKFFNQKAEELITSSFTEYITTQNWSVELKYKKGEPTRVDFKYPTKESTDAFLLTFRFFIQNNEQCSLRNIAEAYKELDIDNDIKNRFFKAREAYNDYIDGEDEILRIEISEKFLTRREILDIVLYGDRAHANIEKRKKVEEMKKNILAWCVVWGEFVSILVYTLKIISYTKELNSKVLSDLKKESRNVKYEKK